MKPAQDQALHENAKHQNAERLSTRNPFGVMDVPDPDGREVFEFAVSVALPETMALGDNNENAEAWITESRTTTALAGRDHAGTIEGHWSSRWNGGADPTIPGDAAHKWKDGTADVRAVGERLYLLFDWDRGARRGLIDARRVGPRLIGKYINLSDPKITRPWIGLIVSNSRIDGRWTAGRLDFRR
jgi:hypothetical protein